MTSHREMWQIQDAAGPVVWIQWKDLSLMWLSLLMGPSQQSIPVSGGINRLLGARQSGFGASAIYRIKHLLQNISHPKPGDFRGLWEIAVSPARGGSPGPKESKARGSSPCWKSRGPLVPESLTIKQHKVSPHEQFQTHLFTHHRAVARITILYK